MTVEKPKPKQLLRPITTGANSVMNQSEFLVITCNSLKGREKSRVHRAIGFAFASHWLKNWRESFKPITKRSNRNHAITFDSHLKTALSMKTDIHNKNFARRLALNRGRRGLGNGLFYVSYVLQNNRAIAILEMLAANAHGSISIRLGGGVSREQSTTRL